MGIYERDYYRGERQSTGFDAKTVVGILILVNAGIWLAQLVLADALTPYLAVSATDIFGSGVPRVWKLVTASFAHADDDPFHLIMNMFLIWLVGRELEQIYGRGEFLALYVVSGAFALFCETVYFQLAGTPYSTVLGASGAAMALGIVYCTHFPHRLIFPPFPLKVWHVCAFYVFFEFVGALAGGDGIAHIAHLAGAGYGYLFRRFDLRYTRLGALVGLGRSGGFRSDGGSRRRKPPRRRRAKSAEDAEILTPFPAPEDQVSERIDAILAKIHEGGMESLTDEEREFLEKNSKRYRSPS